MPETCIELVQELEDGVANLCTEDSILAREHFVDVNVYILQLMFFDVCILTLVVFLSCCVPWPSEI